MTGSDERGVMLLAHHDGILRDYLAEVFTARGFELVSVSNAPAAESALATRDFDVIVAAWSLGGGVPGELYGLLDARASAQRDRFVHMVRSGERVGGDGPAIDPWDSESLVRAVEAVAERSRSQRDVSMSARERAVIARRRPTMLLVDDDPLELMAMARVLEDWGFEVTPAESGNAAIARLAGDEPFDVILSDWYMTDGSGAELYAFLARERPSLIERCVFMSGASADYVDDVPDCPFLPKGQDSPTLLRTLVRILES